MPLDGHEREPTWPDGIRVRGFVPEEDAARVYEVNVEVWLDASDPIEESFEEWRRWLIERESFDSSLWFLALDGDELALLLHSFAAFRKRGYTRATLGVDASSPMGATRLYERAGMRVYRDTVFLERPASPPRATRAD